MEHIQKDSLDKARAAFRSGKYAEALDNYDYFFEHALDDDPHSLYGVRLSCCLDEWAKLGEKYPEALARLKIKRDEALALLVKTKEPEHFHDYVAICEYLKCPELPIEQFIQFHSEDTALAHTIVRFIWEELIEMKQWEVCRSYLPNPDDKYERSFVKFDEAMKVCKSDPSLGGEDFERQIKGWCVRDLSNIILVLMNSGQVDIASSIRKRASSDLESRGCSELMVQIDGRVAL